MRANAVAAADDDDDVARVTRVTADTDDARIARAGAIRERARRAAALSATFNTATTLNNVDAYHQDDDDDDGGDDGGGGGDGGGGRGRDDAMTRRDMDVTRAVLEALTAMQDTQARMNSKLAWITRSLPKVYDAVVNDCAKAIEASAGKIDRVSAQVGALASSAVMTGGERRRGGGATTADEDSGSPRATTATTTAAAVARGGGGSAQNSVPSSRSQSPTRTARGVAPARRRVAFGEVESRNEYVKNLPKIGHISDARELTAGEQRGPQRAGYGPTSVKHAKKKVVKLEDPRKWSREKWLHHLRAHSATLFGDLDDLSIGDMVDSAKCFFVQRGARVVTQGEQGDSMYVVVLGKMHVVVTQPGVNRGESLQVATLLQGDFFGEIALMTGEVRRATVMAPYEGDGNVWVLEFSKKEIGSVMLARQDILRALTDVCANRKLDNLT
jgi:hypothetical protein